MKYPEDFINKVIQGDCLDVMKSMPDKCVDLCLTDPPYGINYQSNMRVVSEKFDKIANDDNDSRFLAYKEIYRILQNDSVAIVFCSFKNYAEDWNELSKLFSIKNCIVWDKGGGGIGDLAHSLLTDYEMALVCHKGAALIRGKRLGSVWSNGKVNPNTMVHPTEKPVQLLNQMIVSFSDRDSVIFDPFLGSGTTAVAAKQLNRDYIGIELDPKYHAIAQERVSKVTKSMF